MKKIYLSSLFCCISVLAFSQSTTVTLYSTGAAGSFISGFSNAAGTRTDNIIRTTTSAASPRGYAVFNLAGLPPAATVTSCTIGYNVQTYTAGVAAACNTYGYAGDLSTVTVGTTLHNDMIAGTLISTTDYGSALGNQTITTNAAGYTFLGTNFGNKVSICWTGGGTNTYTRITGETGTVATTGAHAPYLTIIYNCTGVSGVTATASPTTICTGSTITLTGTGTGTTSYLWTGPGGFTASTLSTSLTATATSGGIYTLTAYNAGGCPTTVNTATVIVNISPAAISGAATICDPGSITVSDATGGGTWSSSNPGVATITAGGLVTAVSQGTTNITYTGSIGGCAVTKTETVNADAAAISGNAQQCVGVTTTFSDASTGGAWSSSVPGVGTIGATTGIFSGILTGTTVVTYNNGCGAPATVVVTVSPIPPSITGPGTVCPDGGTITLNDGTAGGSWSSTPATIATATYAGPTTGVVTGENPGTAIITYTSLSCITTTVITVNPLPTPILGVLKECVGVPLTLSDALAGGTWTSSAPPIATIDTMTGLLTGVSSGTTIITYNTGCGYVTAIDTAIAAPATIVGRDSACVGNFTTFADIPTGGIWSSSNTTVATVLTGSGIVTGMSPGTAIITYTIPPGCSAIALVNVVPLPPPVTGIMHMCPGTTTTLFDGIAGGTWSSAQSYIASVNTATGLVTGIMADTANIIYTDPAGCRTRTTVTVNPLPAPIVGGITVCATNIDTLYDATTGGVWSSGSTGVATVSPTGVVTTINGGVAIISYTLPLTACAVSKSFTVNALPSPIITYNPATNTFYTGTYYVSYQWYCTVQGLIEGATTSHTAAVYTGNYWLIVTDTNGCTGESVPFAYNTAMGVANHNSTELRIYPNPADQVVYIESGVRVLAVISSIDGKTELQQPDAKEINISSLANGLYFISLYNDSGERLMMQKLIKE